MKKVQEVIITKNSRHTIGLIVTDGAGELGKKIDYYLTNWTDKELNKNTYIIESECPRFSSGDSKAVIKNTVRGRDLFFLVDVGNYSCTYKLFNRENAMSPDDHFQDLKRLIQASGGKAHRITVIMPLLYGGRQHRRNSRESLDCASMLIELMNMGVKDIITVDAHDPRVQNAVPLMGFDNIMPDYQVLKNLKHNFPDLSFGQNDFMVVSPDEGAMSRNINYASVLNVQFGMYYKRRDYSNVIDGKNRIVAHEYLGPSVENKNILISDDIISSGESMLNIAYDLKKRKAENIFCNATYAIFTNGLSKFDRAYEEGVISGVLGTNLTYASEELQKREWFYQVDMSKYIAYIIAAVNQDISISTMLDPNEKIRQLLK